MKITPVAPLLLMIPTLVLLTPACLKTRAQVKHEAPTDSSEQESESEATPPQAAQVKDVSHATGGYALDEIKVELTKLSGRVEDLERNQKQGPTVSPEDLKKLQDRVSTLEQNQADMMENIKKAQAAPPANSEASKSLLDTARKQYAAKEFSGAVESLNTLLKNPGKKAEDATFLRGESYFALKEYKSAILDYSKITQKFPKSPHAPMAYYKIGQSFEGLGMKEDAKPFYQELTEKYPKSPEAKKAKAKL